MNKNVIFAVALVILVVVAGLQAVQLTALKSKLASGGVNLKTGSSSSNTNVQTTNSQASLDNLPQMVGGC